MSGTISAAAEKESSFPTGTFHDYFGSPNLTMAYRDPSIDSWVKVEISPNGLIRLLTPRDQTEEASQCLLRHLQQALTELLLPQRGGETYFNDLADLTRTGYLMGSGSIELNELRTRRKNSAGKGKSSSAV